MKKSSRNLILIIGSVITLGTVGAGIGYYTGTKAGNKIEIKKEEQKQDLIKQETVENIKKENQKDDLVKQETVKVVKKEEKKQEVVKQDIAQEVKKPYKPRYSDRKDLEFVSVDEEGFETYIKYFEGGSERVVSSPVHYGKSDKELGEIYIKAFPNGHSAWHSLSFELQEAFYRWNEEAEQQMEEELKKEDLGRITDNIRDIFVTYFSRCSDEKEGELLTQGIEFNMTIYDNLNIEIDDIKNSYIIDKQSVENQVKRELIGVLKYTHTFGITLLFEQGEGVKVTIDTLG